MLVADIALRDSKQTRGRPMIGVGRRSESQTLLEGRYLGGRPPYGYTLRDLGPLGGLVNETEFDGDD
ncbi:hypothetical protein [Micromonospora sp. NPDC005254]|uniref:hypothetical protein n=1 Tax=Micromonospora sp. NPDC005254 TaxID=3364229 RepID=UPI0036C1E007